LGGSSSINGLVYVRGNALDFERWKDDEGARGWGYADVLPYFKRAEGRAEGGDQYRGEDGPLSTSYGSLKNPLHQAWFDAAQQAGYELTEDYNGFRQEGFGRMDMTTRDGTRCSTAKAYLYGARKRSNLRVIEKALATRILFEGKRAVGVEYERGGQRHQIRATREVILSGGPINSVQLLKISGIGPAEELRQHGIKLIADRPGVGANLQDHLEVYMQYQAAQPITLYKYWNIWGKALIGAQWLLTKKGLGASNQFEACGFIRSDKGVEYPDIQYHFLPIAVRYDGQAVAGGHGFQVHTGPMRAKSRGAVTLRSADTMSVPKIQFNYMSDPRDWQDFRKVIRLTREIFEQPAIAPYIKSTIQPGLDLQSDAELDAFVRDHAESAYHPCGTCRMGAADDPMAVVDPECRVIGVEGLRVADSSIFPQVTNGNLNGPSIMTGEKASDHILGRRLPRSNLGPVMSQNWQTSQR
jgi:choline dehydrogenase